jgi:hypothetical protein
VAKGNLILCCGIINPLEKTTLPPDAHIFEFQRQIKSLPACIICSQNERPEYSTEAIFFLPSKSPRPQQNYYPASDFPCSIPGTLAVLAAASATALGDIARQAMRFFVSDCCYIEYWLCYHHWSMSWRPKLVLVLPRHVQVDCINISCSRSTKENEILWIVTNKNGRKKRWCWRKMDVYS